MRLYHTVKAVKFESSVFQVKVRFKPLTLIRVLFYVCLSVKSLKLFYIPFTYTRIQKLNIYSFIYVKS